MGGILSSLNASYTGLKTSQLRVNTTGHNISNANDEFYTRQRVVTQSSMPLDYGTYNIGQGTQLQTITRLHDEFVFKRYEQASQEMEYSEYQQRYLKEVSTYYPEIDDVGIYNDIKNYFDSWKNFANKPGDPAQKLVLAQSTETLTQNIQDTRRRLENLQEEIYEELKVSVDEINRLGEEIANLNKKIKVHESQNTNIKANDLRDKRDELELAMSKLINASVFKSNISAASTVDTKIADFDDEHVINIAGYSVVDNAGFHPLTIDNKTSSSGFYSVYFTTQDYRQVDITTDLRGGKVGSLIDLCLGRDENKVCTGEYGKIQQFIDDLDTFSKGLIEATNNLYMQSARNELVSDHLPELNSTDEVTLSPYDVRSGDFDIVMYNNAGEELSRKTITINSLTNMNDILDQINSNKDDNEDNNSLNDIDDKFTASFNDETHIFQILPNSKADGLYISIVDNGTNVGGALGLNRFFDGYDANDISLAQKYMDDPTLLTANSAPIDGNFDIANMMQQLQYDDVEFLSKDGVRESSTIPDFFKKITTRVGTETESAMTLYETRSAVFQSVQLEFTSVSQVNIDEELTNLMKYQTGYSANAKVVTAIDQMITTLLGMKQ